MTKEEAIKVVRDNWPEGRVLLKSALETLIPELKESEDDRIKTNIIKLLRFVRDTYHQYHDECNEAIAWLEKQGELVNSLSKGIDNAHERIDGLIQKNNSLIEQLEKQGEQKVDKCKDCNNVKGCIICTDGDQYAHITKQNPTDKTEPKFKNGQWIVWQDKCYKVNYNGCGYELVDQNGLSTSLEYGTIDENAHIWNIIQDAKDGDVLLFEGNYNSIVLFQGIGINGEGRINYHCKCDLGDYSFGIQGDVACLGIVDKDAEHYHPATKEQRDLLFSKMGEAGYYWDAEKKELKKIDAREILPLDGDLMEADCKVVEQKPEWSEEDEERFNRVCSFIWKNRRGDTSEIYQQELDVEWLKSIKKRMKGE